MVASQMEKKVDSLEGALNVMQKQLEERDIRFTAFQSSFGEILNRIVARLNGREQSKGGARRHDSGLLELNKPSPRLRHAHCSDQWWKLDICLLHGEDLYTSRNWVERYFGICMVLRSNGFLWPWRGSL